MQEKLTGNDAQNCLIYAILATFQALYHRIGYYLQFLIHILMLCYVWNEINDLIS